MNGIRRRAECYERWHRSKTKQQRPSFARPVRALSFETSRWQSIPIRGNSANKLTYERWIDGERRKSKRHAARVSHIMPALISALNALFEKKALKKHYWALFEHYLPFWKLKQLEDWWKPETRLMQGRIDTELLAVHAIFSSITELCASSSSDKVS